MEKLKEQQFKLNTPCLAIMVARRGSGKSYLMRYLLYCMTKAKKFDAVILISPTAAFNGEYSGILPEKNIIAKFSAEYIYTLLEAQKKIIAKGKINRICLILDDCLGSVKFNNPIFDLLSTTGRHYQLSVFCLMQHYKKIPPSMRGNADYAFILGSIGSQIIQHLYEEYSPENTDNWKELKTIYDEASQARGCLVINNANNGSLHTIRAPPDPPKFTIVGPTAKTHKRRP